MIRALLMTLALAGCAGSAPAPSDKPVGGNTYDLVIRGGTVYDGSGSAGRRADVGIRGDRIAAVGDLSGAQAPRFVDAGGLAVAPGFINMLSWSNESLLVDGRSQGEIRQGVTLEVLGEGRSMGPLNDAMKAQMRREQGDLRHEVAWTTLAEYLQHLEKRGVSTNVASFIGAATVRTHVLGLEDVQPTPAQMEQMRELVRREMQAGALGIGSALIYTPGSYARTEELVELCKVAAQYQGKYTSHIRSEGAKQFEALDELIRIAREAGIPAEVHHIKVVAGSGRMDRVLARINEARREGLKVTANMYLYAASSNALESRLPAWAHSGGPQALHQRLDDAATREKIAAEMRAGGRPSKTLLLRMKNPGLQRYVGKTLAEVARDRGVDEVQATIDLVREERARIQVATFSMDEADIPKALRQPWVSLGSDGSSLAAEGVFLRSATHPRSYGNFARLLGKYVREDKVISLEEAVRRLSGQPATNLGLDSRGFVKEGMYADLAIFDPATIADTATFENPHSYAVGMKHVFVNGVQVIDQGEHTGAKPGRAVWGPGRVAR